MNSGGFSLAIGRLWRRGTTFANAVMIAAIASAPALAQDTEIYQSQLSAGSPLVQRPNVLFVLDTSGSMRNLTTGNKPFDPGKARTFYDGGTGTCRHDRIYWSRDGRAPDCTTNQYFERSALRCLAARSALANGGTGVYQDRLARYDATNRDWRSLGTTRAERSPPHVECRTDRGTHGNNTGDAEVFIVTGQSVPWMSTPTFETDWAATGEFYTLFSAKYMNYLLNGTNADPGTPMRMDVVTAATNTIIAANHQNVLAGLMRFDTRSHCLVPGRRGCLVNISGNKGGPVVFPVSDLTLLADRQRFQTAVGGLAPGGQTPLAETLYEAMLYFRGEAPHFGTNPPTPNNFQSDPSTLSGGSYRSPIVGKCQKNHIVYLTDGDPVRDIDADQLIATRLAGASASISDKVCAHVEGATNSGDNCLDELSEYLAKEDQSTSIDGTQTVNVYTIGFLTDQALLRAAAAKGNGQYFTASNANELADAFQQILTDIQEDTSTFSAPAVSVNAFNRITNRDELFFSLFSPTNRARWPGNIKRYELACANAHATLTDTCADDDGDGLPDPPVIVDAAGLPAIDTRTGFFRPGARSVWTHAGHGPDGPNTQAGGAASVFGGAAPGSDDPPSPARRVFTFTGAYVASSTSGGLFTPQTTDGILSAATNLVSTANANLIAEVDNIPTGGDGKLESFFYPGGRDPGDPPLPRLVNWTLGIDVLDVDNDGSTTDARHQIGDALHAEPVLVTYGSTSTNPDITLYTINNDGYLHGIDIDDGSEVFSFVPQEALRRIPSLFVDQATSSGKTYGLDGPITVWFNDVDADGVLDTADGDHVYLYFGQRRGGRNYYALDVTNRTAPKLLWKIQGGLPNSAFQELGQTWSSMVHAKIKLNGTVRDVMVFAAGYDPAQDRLAVPRDDSIGRGIFMVDARTGERVWHARSNSTPLPTPRPNLLLPDMQNSIPSDINIFDITGDGLADRMYVGDTRGQVWRFDIQTENTGAGSLVIGTRLAALQQISSSATPGPDHTRRFYYRPDVTFVNPEDAAPFLGIAIGSGYRAHPLNTQIKDRFYLIRDPLVHNVSSTLSYPTTITEADLADLTTNISPTGAQLAGTAASPLVGWYIKLQKADGSFAGEKVLAEAVVFNNVVLFTTFTPPTSPLTDDCEPNQGDGRVYTVNLLDGSPVNDLDESGGSTLTRADRSLKLLRDGIPPSVVILFSRMNGVVPVAFAGPEQVDVDFSDAPVKTYWFKQEVQ